MMMSVMISATATATASTILMTMMMMMMITVIMIMALMLIAMISRTSASETTGMMMKMSGLTCDKFDKDAANAPNVSLKAPAQP